MPLVRDVMDATDQLAVCRRSHITTFMDIYAALGSLGRLARLGLNGSVRDNSQQQQLPCLAEGAAQRASSLRVRRACVLCESRNAT